MWGDDHIFETYCSETYSSEPRKFNGWQAIAGFIGRWFKKASLVNKKVHVL